MSFKAVITSLALLLPAHALFSQTYEEGRQAYVNGEYKRAYAILKPLAEQGDAEAQKMLGILYDYGHGIRADADEAMRWYLLAANQGHPAVQYQVGAKYFHGDGVNKDIEAAARWWELAASGGQVDAQFNLGILYFRGTHMPKDDEKARRLFEQAAAQGHGQAQYSLAVMYAFGRGVKKNYATALIWFERAAAQGVAQAQFNLGVFYENGYAVEKNREVAREWYGRAATQGLPRAKEKLALLNDNITNNIANNIGGIKHPDDVALNKAITRQHQQAYSPEATTVRSADEKPRPTGNTSGIKGGNWVKNQSPEHYTLQLISVLEERDVITFIQRNGIAPQAAYIEIVIDGTTRYNALYGVFNDYDKAKQAAERLSGKLKNTTPWVRNFGILHKLMR